MWLNAVLVHCSCNPRIMEGLMFKTKILALSLVEAAVPLG